MATDIVPALLGKIETAFGKRVENDQFIGRFMGRIKNGTATQREVQRYAQRLGDILADILQETIVAGTLPNDRMYWNIADRTLRPLLKGNYDLINNIAAQVQLIADKLARIGINSVYADFPENRVAGLIDRVSGADGINQLCSALGEPIVNCTMSFYDDFLKANAEARFEAGFEETIVRTGAAGCCNWCADIAGSYVYGKDIKSGADVFKRHLYCRCLVERHSGRLREDVWSGRTWTADAEGLAARKAANHEITRYTPEQAKALEERLLHDRKVAQLMKEKKITRAQAGRKLRQTTKRKID